MGTEMVKFLEEGRALLEEMKQSHEHLKVAQELANEKQKSANDRFSLIQWVIILILAPMMVSTSINTVNLSGKLDKDEAYELFPTKPKVVYLQNDLFELNQRLFSIRESTYIQKAELKYGNILKEFVGDNSRSAE